MCQFFSLVSDGMGNIFYFDWKLRKKCLEGKEIKGHHYVADSHTSIADYFGYKGEKEDTLNKYEFNPLTKVFTIDQLNTKDDSKIVNKKSNSNLDSYLQCCNYSYTTLCDFTSTTWKHPYHLGTVELWKKN